VNTVPIELPVKPSDAAALANLIFQYVEKHALNDEARNRLNGRVPSLELSSIVPYIGSLQKDPIHASSYYIAVDASSLLGPRPLLLHMTLASSPASSQFSEPLLIGRMRPGGGREIVVNAIPFSFADRDNLRAFTEHIDRAFLPRPQGSQPAIAVEGGSPEVTLPAAFDAFRAIWKRYGVNAASIAPGGTGAGLWAAIRAGWRDGYSAGTSPIIAGENLDAAKREIETYASFTRFVVDSSGLTGRPVSFPLPEEFQQPLPIADRSYEFSEQQTQHLAEKFGRGLQALAELYDFIQTMKSQQNSWKYFDFEVTMGAQPTPEELIFCLHWLKTRGRPAQIVGPFRNSEHLNELAAIARHYNCVPSVRSTGGETEGDLQAIGQATGGRVHYKVSADGLDAGRVEITRHLIWLAENLRP
jgi:hypothetical protein